MTAVAKEVPHVVLIDNYDSFTWNVYEVLCREGARVSVYRNDEITIDDVKALNPTHLLISPGPGNPEEDSGISREVISQFMGKVPIFGICMGLQCIVSMMGGKVEFAGEIMHGKTSAISHDNRGCFENVSQDVNATRYHSLAATLTHIPDSLEVSARLEESGMVQGVRHRECVVEGVQFHPESILTQEGNIMLRNFLNYNAGKWTDIHRSSDKKVGSILDKIYAQRRLDVRAAQEVLGQSLGDLEKSLALGLAPPCIDFKQQLKNNMGPHSAALIAEIKRASPSKGLIAPNIHAPTQAQEYAHAGASGISVLTEPKWFKGSLDDLVQVRRSLDAFAQSTGKPRPALLRKEFIFDNYQIAEARLAGADTVLLIVKMLTDAEITNLTAYSRKLGMEPLVEVSNSAEMERALKLGSAVIGVNNRDLHSFNVDLTTTSGLVGLVKNKDVVLLALSGILEAKQVAAYAAEGVKAILVGESLMRAPNTREFAQSLIHF